MSLSSFSLVSDLNGDATAMKGVEVVDLITSEEESCSSARSHRTPNDEHVHERSAPREISWPSGSGCTKVAATTEQLLDPTCQSDGASIKKTNLVEASSGSAAIHPGEDKSVPHIVSDATHGSKVIMENDNIQDFADKVEWNSIRNRILLRAKKQIIDEMIKLHGQDITKREILDQLIKTACDVASRELNAPTTVPTSLDGVAVAGLLHQDNGVGHTTEHNSPYTERWNAEEGEETFKLLKNLLTPNIKGKRDRGRHAQVQPCARAILQFGELRAERLVLARYLIKKASMGYNGLWRTGVIQNTGCRVSDLDLLLCLDEQRFCGAGESVLGSVAADLSLTSLIKEAVDDWGLTEEYPKVMSITASLLSFKSKCIECLRCQIFVAKAYCCMYALGRSQIEGSLAKKVTCYLTILEDNVQVIGSSEQLEESEEVVQAQRNHTPRNTQHGGGTSKVVSKKSRTAKVPLKSTIRKPYDRKEVEKICLETGKVLARYDSPSAVFSALQRSNGGTLYQVLNGKVPSYNGFFWRYSFSTSAELVVGLSTSPVAGKSIITDNKEHSENNSSDHDYRDEAGPSKRTIKKICLTTGKVLAQYDSQGAVFRSLRVSRSGSLSRVLHGKQPSYKGFFWRY